MGTPGQLDGSLPLLPWASDRPCVQRGGGAGGIKGPRSASQARGAGKVIIEFRGTSPSPAGESGKRNYTNPGTASVGAEQEGSLVWKNRTRSERKQTSILSLVAN